MENRTIFPALTIPADCAPHTCVFLQDINQALEFINQIPLKKLNEIIKELQTLVAEQQACTDLDKKFQLSKQIIAHYAVLEAARRRSSFVNLLTEPDQKSRLIAAIKKMCKTGEEFTEKEIALNKLFNEIAPYQRFAHLTADELAAAAIMIDGLMNCIRTEINNHPAAKDQLQEKCAELEAAKEEIKICMQKHLDMFEANPCEIKMDGSYVVIPRENLLKDQIPLTESQNHMAGSFTLPDAVQMNMEKNNDILYQFNQKLHEIFNCNEKIIPLHSKPIDIDSSLLLPVPLTPFSNVQNDTVISYFKKYLQEKTLPHQGTLSVMMSFFQFDVKNVLGIHAEATANAILAQGQTAINAVVNVASTLSHNLMNWWHGKDETSIMLEEYTKFADEIRERNEKRKNNAPSSSSMDFAVIPKDLLNLTHFETSAVYPAKCTESGFINSMIALPNSKQDQIINDFINQVFGEKKESDDPEITAFRNKIEKMVDDDAHANTQYDTIAMCREAYVLYKAEELYSDDDILKYQFIKLASYFAKQCKNNQDMISAIEDARNEVTHLNKVGHSLMIALKKIPLKTQLDFVSSTVNLMIEKNVNSSDAAKETTIDACIDAYGKNLTIRILKPHFQSLAKKNILDKNIQPFQFANILDECKNTQHFLETKHKLIHLLFSERKRLSESKNKRFACFFSADKTTQKIEKIETAIIDINENISSLTELKSRFNGLLNSEDIRQSRSLLSCSLFKRQTTIEKNLNAFRAQHLLR